MSWENFDKGKIGKFGESCQNFLANIHRYTKHVFGIPVCTDFSLFTKFFLAIAFTCIVHQKFTLTKFSNAQ